MPGKNTNAALEELFKSLDAEDAAGQAGGGDNEDSLVKSQDGDEDDEEGYEDAEEDEGGDEDEDEDDMEKGGFGGDDEDDLVKSIDASPVLSRLADAIDAHGADVIEAIEKSISEQDTVNGALIKGINAVLSLVKSQNATIAALNAKIDSFGGEPLPRAAMQPGQQVLAKGLPGAGAPAGVEGANNRLAKSYGLHPAVLQQKLIKAIGQGLLPERFAQEFDRTGTIPADAFEIVKSL